MFPNRTLFVWLFSCVRLSLGSLSEEFDAYIDEVQSLMQTSKWESSMDVSARFRDMTTSEDRPADALFLIKTTFGPSLTSLDKIEHMTHEEWVAEQMSLPVVSHREYFRQRVNPPYTPAVQGPTLSRLPCNRGARWITSTFTLDDKGASVEVDADHNIYVDGAFRSALQKGGIVSRWSFVSNFSGYLCSVFEGVGQTLAFGSVATCTDTVLEMPNPAVWSADAVQTSFDLHVLPNGVVVLKEEADPCNVEKSTVISQGNLFYRFDDRLAFVENTPENPDPDVCAAPPNALNKDSCKLLATRNRTVVPGFTVTKTTSGVSQTWIDSDLAIFNGNYWYDDLPDTKFGLSFQGGFQISSPGDYDFFLRSDDGSFMYLDGALVIDNGGDHGKVTVKTTVTLSSGTHDILITYGQNNGGKYFEFWYTGPDTDGETLHPTADILFTVPASTISCYVACGSSGEVASEPHYGHQFPLNEEDDTVTELFSMVDNYHTPFPGEYSKSTVFTEIVLHAEDQLRQRVAWALAQIFVVGVDGVGYQYKTETWVNFYDTFVRNAFGNLKKILRAIVWSPLMGLYLTHVGSHSYEYSSSAPNENLAREIMQLFTIGLFELNDDGSEKIEGGDSISTYGSDVLLNFARVLTGFEITDERHNVEYTTGGNVIDATHIDALKHDVNPKPDFDGNFIGDGFPLCEDFSLVRKGAIYQYEGEHYFRNVLVLNPGTNLYQAFCGQGETCEPPFVLELIEDVVCEGDECGGPYEFVSVAGYLYKFVPRCVHLQFSEGDSVTVDENGDISFSGGTYQVQWADGYPSTGSYVVNVKTELGFTVVPDVSSLTSKLFVTTFAPVEACSSCDGDVKAFTENGVMTVFEYGGTYYNNSVSTVVISSNQSQHFRNPPVFLKTVWDSFADEKVVYEVEAFVDTLFHHNNVPIFISKSLLARFGKSNPSGTYVQAVQQAFRSGEYDGTVYSGEYGDLASTVAAIVLHPEFADAGSSTDGAMREPFLKVMHLMRSMEYADDDSTPIVLRNLQDELGQHPYEQPSVFSFFKADFELDTTEYEPHGEEKTETSVLLAPEYELMTPPHVVAFLNVATALIRQGVSYHCEASGMTDVGIASKRVGGSGEWIERCPQGRFHWRGGNSTEAIVDELDILLTGGRLTSWSRESVLEAYSSALPGRGVQAAIRSVVLTPEFNTLGDPLPLPTVRESDGSIDTDVRDYKAQVMVFLWGGADTYNMVVPQECYLWDEYVDIRTDVALSAADLLTITAADQVCTMFGVHSALSFVKSLYDDGEASFISNIGSMVEPYTKSALLNHEVKRCRTQGSHSNDANHAKNLKCQEQDAVPKGVGGRIADMLAQGSMGYNVKTFGDLWSTGFSTKPTVLSASVVKIQDYDLFRDVISNVTSQLHQNVYAEAYAQALRGAVVATRNEVVANELASLATNYPASYRDQWNMKAIARMIAARDIRKAERDFFQTQLGDWDYHQSVLSRLSTRFKALDDILDVFVTELKGQDVWNNVVVQVRSEFGRTLESNGGGSDHGWGGNSLILSGALNGGRILNRFPASYAPGNSRDWGRGRLIPEFPWESIDKPVAVWMGMEEDQVEYVFPNFHNFNESEHIIPYSSVFKK